MSINLQPAFADAGTHVHDNLIGGTAVNMVTESIVLDAGNLTRGALLGKIATGQTGAGKYVLSLSTALDGSEVPVAVLAEDTDATSGDKTTVAYLSGEFNTAAMTFGAAHTVASVKDALQARGIYLKTNQPA